MSASWDRSYTLKNQ